MSTSKMCVSLNWRAYDVPGLKPGDSTMQISFNRAAFMIFDVKSIVESCPSCSLSEEEELDLLVLDWLVLDVLELEVLELDMLLELEALELGVSLELEVLELGVSLELEVLELDVSLELEVLELDVLDLFALSSAARFRLSSKFVKRLLIRDNCDRIACSCSSILIIFYLSPLVVTLFCPFMTYALILAGKIKNIRNFSYV